MKIAIVGSRTYRYLDEVREYVASLPPDTIVVSGGARGVDRVAVEAAQARGLTTIVLEADWRNRGAAAGYERNDMVVKTCDKLVAFWDHDSRGTKDTIVRARRAGKEVEIRRPKGSETP